MVTLQRIPAALAQVRRPDPEAARFRIGEAPKAPHVRMNDSSFFRHIRLLPLSRRKAMYAFYTVCHEVHGIAEGDTSRMLKLAMLADWRAEIALLYAGRPQHVVTRALYDAVNRSDLRLDDFRLMIDCIEMDTRTDIWARPFAQLNLYCERTAVAVGRITLRNLQRGEGRRRSGRSRARSSAAAYRHSARPRPGRQTAALYLA
jgi:phytoene/squalene synthetase